MGATMTGYLRHLAAMALAGAAATLPGGLAAQGSRRVIPNDPWFHNQISFYFGGGPTSYRVSSTSTERRQVTMAPGISLDLPEAWAITTGSRSVVVAVLDDGFFYAHEDIAGNVWRNPGESGTDSAGLDKATNGRDDDGNGYVDDVVGYDFAFDDPDPDSYVFDGMDRGRIQPYQHSIPALGIIGAVGNDGKGIAGINWRVSLMLLKIGAQGIPRGMADSMRAPRAARAIRYAVDNGARIINWSGFISDTSAAGRDDLRRAVVYARDHGVLLVAGAGNSGVDLDDDANCVYPQCFDEPNVIRVAELDFDGTLVRFRVGDEWRGSNFGARRVEVAAIGQNFSTNVTNGRSSYRVFGGTSNAGPVVAGVAALMLAVDPTLRASDLKRLIMETATKLPALNGKVTSGGTVNAYRAVLAARAHRRS
jgi:subtilisin family serine protease